VRRSARLGPDVERGRKRREVRLIRRVANDRHRAVVCRVRELEPQRAEDAKGFVAAGANHGDDALADGGGLMPSRWSDR
jgi:hypothetical protein